MTEQFGGDYVAYRQRVPMFIPRLRDLRRLLQPQSSSPAPRA